MTVSTSLLRAPHRKNWSYRYWKDGKQRWLGMGSVKEVSLKEARLARDAARLRVKGDRSTPGIDIVQEKRAAREEAKAVEIKVTLPNFEQCAEVYIRQRSSTWSKKHRNQWPSSLKRHAYSHITVHGFRSTFATWAEECTDYPDGVREAALAHKYKSETTAAYQRGQKLEKRRVLVKDWAQFLEGSNVIQFGKVGRAIHATRVGRTLFVEAKGYPAKTYRDPRRAGEVKPTNPTNQAQQWYSRALLKVMRLQAVHPDAVVALGFPDFPRYPHCSRRRVEVWPSSGWRSSGCARTKA